MAGSLTSLMANMQTIEKAGIEDAPHSDDGNC